jgi:DNA polymerase theta
MCELCQHTHTNSRALLEAIATKLATSDETLDDYVKHTLLYHSMDHDKLSLMVQTTMQDLEDSGLVTKGPYSDYTATLMGQAIVASGLTPEDGIFVHRQLRKALQAFVLDCELHVLYAFTPVQTTATSINWQIFRKEVERLDESNMRVLEFVGLKPSVINKM